MVAIHEAKTGPITVERLTALVEAIADEAGSAAPVKASWNGEHSNDILALDFDDGRTLMIKRARHDWVAPRFEAARAASRLLRHRANVVAPAPLDVPPGIDDLPVQAYWRIPLPTLGAVWPRLSERARARALHSLGRLVRRIHGIRLPGWGPLPGAVAGGESLETYLEYDLAQRLLPAVTDIWPEARPALEALVELVPGVARRAERAGGVLVHNDLHLGNVLCEVEGDDVRCVGLLDLEASLAAPAASDLASFEAMHGPLFEQSLEPRRRREFHKGYGARPDAAVFAFYGAVHLANMGFHSALLGHDEHAARVAAAFRDAVRITARRLSGNVETVAYG